jgi:CheY-like chemotaxis protein
LETGEGKMSAAERPVLVIDDDLDILEIMAMVLESSGYSVRTARNGKEALDLMHGGLRPGLIVLDLMMPVMNGWEFRENQLRDSALARLPVVALSGSGNVKEAAQELGLTEYLLKPIDTQTLLDLVRRYIPD